MQQEALKYEGCKFMIVRWWIFRYLKKGENILPLMDLMMASKMDSAMLLMMVPKMAIEIIIEYICKLVTKIAH